MKIRMKAAMAGPDGVRHEGKDYDVDEKLGQELIKGGYAQLAPKAHKPAKGAEAAKSASSEGSKEGKDAAKDKDGKEGKN